LHCVSSPYDPEVYNSLPNLLVAHGQLADLGAMTADTIPAALGPVRDLFLKHKVCDDVGIVLLHNHFRIRPTERLVDFRNISAPWDVGNDTDAVVSKYGRLVLPRSFRLFRGAFMPYEFEFSDETWPRQMSVTREFLDELSALLYRSRLDQVVGLRLLDSHDSELAVEVTEGNVNIMLPRGTIPDTQLIPALWVFGEDERDNRCPVVCSVDAGGSHVKSRHVNDKPDDAAQALVLNVPCLAQLQLVYGSASAAA
jgi:hypothetical protein